MSHLFLTPPCGFKAAQCSSQPIPSGRRVPIFRSGVGCGFRLWPRWETSSHSDHKFRVAVSAKASTGNCVPFLSRILGRSFRQDLQLETASHSKGKFRDGLSEAPPIRKARPTLNASGHGAISLLGLPSIKWRPPGRRARSSSRVPHAKKAT